MMGNHEYLENFKGTWACFYLLNEAYNSVFLQMPLCDKNHNLHIHINTGLYK